MPLPTGLQSFNKIYPLMIKTFASFSPLDYNVSITDKVNAMIDYLNQVGALTNDTVVNWNKVMNWAMNDGLDEATTQSVNAKMEAMLAAGDFDDLLQNISSLAQEQINLINTNQVAKQVDLNATNEQLADEANKTSNISNKLYKSFSSIDSHMGICTGNSHIAGSFFSNCLGTYKLVRTDIVWQTVETAAGVYDFSSYDTLINNLISNGFVPYIELDYSNPLYAASNISMDSSIFSHFKDFVSATVTHFANKGIYWEIYNEPNLSRYWTPQTTGTPSDYANLLSQLYPVIKTADQTGTVVGMALSLGIWGFNDAVNWLENSFSAGALNSLDAISVHPYNMTGPEDLIPYYDTLKGLVNKYTDKYVPIFCGEVGYSTCPNWNGSGNAAIVTEATRAKYLPRLILVDLLSGIERTIILNYTGAEADNTQVEDWFGIYAPDGSPHLTATAITNLITALTGYAFVGRESTSPNDYILYFMDSVGNMKCVYWTTIVNHSLMLNGISLNLTDTPQIQSINFQIPLMNKLKEIEYKAIGSGIKKPGTIDSSKNETFNDYINNQATGSYSHAEGKQSIAGDQSHAQGVVNLAYPGAIYSITGMDIENKIVTLNNVTNLSVGNLLAVKADWEMPLFVTITAINGLNVTLNVAPAASWVFLICLNNAAYASHAEGANNLSCGTGSHAEGVSNKATMQGAHAEGNRTAATSFAAHAEGNYTSATAFASHAMGQYNKAMFGAGTSYSGTADAFVLGNGINGSSLGNAFRVTFDGKVYGLSAFNSTGADYAEYFEWSDENLNQEDRVGYFVSFDDGEKIRKANASDMDILGIVSASPSVVGDSCQDDWKDKYVMDDFGRIQYQTVSVPESTDSGGNVTPAHDEYQPVINPEWNQNQEYTPREQRPEWSAIGMMGKLLVRDDGSCQVNGYCKPNDNGAATTSSDGYRVLSRAAQNIVLVLFK